jgi:hypothetical protein
MTERRARLAAWSLFCLTMAMVLTTVVIGIADPNASAPAHPNPTGPAPGDEVAPGTLVFGLLTLLVCAAFALAGAVVAARRPRNAVGWLLCCAGLSLAVTALSDTLYWHLAFGREVAPAAAQWFAWIEGWSWIPAVVPLFSLIPLLFPTGAPPSPRWRIVGWSAASAGVVMVIGTALKPGAVEDVAWVDNPLAVEGLGLGALSGIAFAVWAGTALAALASLVVRYRRSRGIERQQLKWMTAAGCLLVLSFVVSAAWTSPASEQAGWATLLVGLASVAGAVAVAMLRYRLYDLDVVINRALVYTALTATLAGCYVGAVLLLQLVLSPSSDLAIAASTLAVAALFRPARSRIQALVDRRFYRSRYDAARTLDHFGARLREEVDIDALAGELRGVVSETMQPTHVSLWVRETPR